MTTTEGKSAATRRGAAINGAPPPIPSAPVIAPTKKRRPVGLLAAAVLLMIGGGLATVWAINSSAERTEVVGVAREVPWGQLITAQDLTVVEIVDDVSLRPVLWSARADLIGQRARVELLPGTLITQDAVGEDSVPAAGQAVVGVTVKIEQAPLTALTPQDNVRLVLSPSAGAATSNPVAEIDGTVLAVSAADVSGTRTVDVLVPEQQSTQLATAAAASRVSIILVPRR